MTPSDPTPSRPLLVATRDGGTKGRVDTALGWAVAVLMGLSVLNVLWQVFTRFALPQPSGFTDELARFLLIWVGLLGAAYASGQGLHLAIDLLPRALSGKARAALGLVIQGAVVAFALGAMAFGGGYLVWLTFVLEQTSAALGLPLGVVYSVLPLSGLLIAYYAALAWADHLRTLRGQPTHLTAPDRPSAEAFGEHERDVARAGVSAGDRQTEVP
ncbi:MAG: TRAP transporter small permease [Bacteroidota bacterium]